MRPAGWNVAAQESYAPEHNFNRLLDVEFLHNSPISETRSSALSTLTTFSAATSFATTLARKGTGGNPQRGVPQHPLHGHGFARVVSDIQGRDLNVGLSRQKEMFGARSIVFQHYALDLS